MDTKPETLVIVGGVAGGASAAARARRHSETAHIILLERGPDVSFANCGLPYHIGGEIADRAELSLQTPESLRALLNLDVRTLTEATSIDRAGKRVRVRSLVDGAESEIAYDKLILAPGASPLRPPLPGIGSPRIHTLRNLQDMDRIIATAIRGRLGIDDLAHLELSYAPPFGSAKDVVNVAGFAAGNIRDGLLVPVPDLRSAGAQIIDVRPAASAAKLPVPGAKNIPLGELRSRLAEIDRSQPVFTICQMGKTSYFAARILANHGFDARSILGGAHHQVR